MPGVTRLRLWVALAVLLAGLCSSPARADDGKIQVTVISILATDKNTEIDEKLKDIAKEIQKKEPTLTGFKVERITIKPVKIGEKESFNVFDEKTVVVVTLEKNEKDGTVSLTIKPPTVGEITYTCCCGKYFPVITRFQTADKSRLIVAVMARPCPMKK
jgi:hypothetical protein